MKRLERLFLLGLAVLCGGLSGVALRDHLAFADFRTLAAQVGQLRVNPADADRLRPVLARLGRPDCLSGARRDIAIVQLYAADLAALARDIDPLEPTPDAPLNTARRAALERVDAALACAPLDGDLWLRSAFMTRALGRPEAEVAKRVALSVRTTPHEEWITKRRDVYFPDTARRPDGS